MTSFHSHSPPHLRAILDLAYGSISIYCHAQDDAGPRIGKPLELEAVTSSSTYHEPILRLDSSFAQVLMDDLWRCGLRPTEGAGSAGALSATQAHLKDMQTISFKLLEDILHYPPITMKSKI